MFIGYFGTLTNLDSLSNIFKIDRFDIIILLDKQYSKDIIQDISYSKQFIDQYYVANANANSYFIRYINEKNADEFYKNPFDNDFIIDDKSGLLIFKEDVFNTNNKLIAKAFIFKDLDDIDYKNLEVLQRLHIIGTVVIVLLLISFLSYVYLKVKVKDIEIENNQLIVENKELQQKTKDMEFTEKKMLNLFDAQPNIMIMHNGKEVVKGNKRFLGFFNRFGSFEGFRSKHRCISELFEKFEAKDYIYTQYIEGMYWIDYMLTYPKRPYKTVMSINGDPHHFYIKFNEMKYAKYSDERLIFVAFVDFTADLKNYEDCYKFQKFTKEAKKQDVKKDVKVTINKKEAQNA